MALGARDDEGGELVPSHAAGDAAVACAPVGETLGEGAQHGVPGPVAVGVVDARQSCDVEVEEELGPIEGCMGQYFARRAQEMLAVGNAGEFVVMR